MHPFLDHRSYGVCRWRETHPGDIAEQLASVVATNSIGGFR